ncbi:MAG: hypothetical protein VYA77_08230 [Pseudomonadota bacterium]|nr:hypothetical protein [Pseudomonadota bacterium]
MKFRVSWCYINIIQTAISAVFLCLGVALLLVIVPIMLPLTGIPLALMMLNPRWRKFSEKKAYHIWIAFDRLVNALLWHDSRETLSSRLGKALYWRHPPVFNWLWIDAAVSWALDKVDPDHCFKSIDWSVGRGKDWHRVRWSDPV